jgi:hypothetical protein
VLPKSLIMEWLSHIDHGQRSTMGNVCVRLKEEVQENELYYCVLCVYTVHVYEVHVDGKERFVLYPLFYILHIK